RHAGARRRAQRARAARGRPHLPGEGHVHPARALPRDGAAPRRVPAHSSKVRPRAHAALGAIDPHLRRPAMKVALLGGTRGMGRSLARLMAERGDAIALLGRDENELKRSAADLIARGGPGTKASVAVCDLKRPETFGPALEDAEGALGGLDTVVVTAGL